MAVIRDPSLPHQIVLLFAPGGKIVVSCNCLRRETSGQAAHQPIETRSCWLPGEAMAVYRRFHDEELSEAV